jgi:hypothetical protein
MPDRRLPARLMVVAPLLACLVYLNALDNPFAYDDYRTVRGNPTINDLGAFWTIVLGDVSRPLVNLSYALDRAVWGPAPFGFHLTNVVLHALNCALLFLLVWHLAEDRGRRPRREGWDATDPTTVALVASALFAIHPMLTQAVGYVSGRAEVLCATFFLSSLVLLHRWSQRDGFLWLVGALATWVAALASKEVAAMWPLVALATDCLAFRDDPLARRRRVLRVYLPAACVVAAAATWRLTLLTSTEYPGETGVFWKHILVELDVIRRYASLLVLPFGQSVFHRVVSIDRVWGGAALLAVGWTVALVVFSWWMRRREPLLTLGAVWFLLLLVPSAVLVVLNLGEPMAEHRVYLASVGFFLGTGILFARVAAWARRSSRLRMVVRLAMVLWGVGLAGLAVHRNTLWQNPVALWLDAVKQAPDVWVPHFMLGQALREAGMRQEAVVAFRRAIALQPREAGPYTLLGACLLEMERLADAQAVFQTLTEQHPSFGGGYSGLGAVALLSGRAAEAREHFERALALDPSDAAVGEWLEKARAAEASPVGTRGSGEGPRPVGGAR